MGLLFIIIFIVVIAIFLCKKFNVSKKVISIIVIIMIIIGIIILRLGKFNVINKILYSRYANMPTITQEQRDNAIAVIELYNFSGIDATSSYTYYIFNDQNVGYSYLKTHASTTIAGPQEEKINKAGNIKNKNRLEKIINNLEKDLNSDPTSNISCYWQGSKVTKEELLNSLFPN